MATDCYSNSWQTGDIPEQVVTYPFTGNQVAVDACLVDRLQTLWALGIETSGSCCGHGQRPASVVVDLEPLLAVLGPAVAIKEWLTDGD